MTLKEARKACPFHYDKRGHRNGLCMIANCSSYRDVPCDDNCDWIKKCKKEKVEK